MRRKSEKEGLFVYVGFPSGSAIKNLLANAGNVGFILESGRSPGEGNSNPLQSSSIRNPMREAWCATVHRVSKSWIQLNN